MWISAKIWLFYIEIKNKYLLQNLTWCLKNQFLFLSCFELLGTWVHVHLYDCFHNSRLNMWLKSKSSGMQTINRKENLTALTKALQNSWVVRDSKMGMNSLLLNPRMYFTLTLFKHGGGYHLITVSEHVQFSRFFFKCLESKIDSFVVPIASKNMASFTKEKIRLFFLTLKLDFLSGN